ncbi:dynein assembly factor 1, axonemal [Platysternon megacephalum]|uniref:Dynein assembly factor 1, axonemal n=1 Tax=Platysternon megacephalum TaxID=55544 RepID=A0A4D9E1N3_9SAUR|nr:dynein assembly factor 1, axonemal [Platysternon megacephalum]
MGVCVCGGAPALPSSRSRQPWGRAGRRIRLRTHELLAEPISPTQANNYTAWKLRKNRAKSECLVPRKRCGPRSGLDRCVSAVQSAGVGVPVLPHCMLFTMEHGPSCFFTSQQP